MWCTSQSCCRCGAQRGVTNAKVSHQRSFSWRKIIAWGMIDFSNSIVLMVTLALYPGFATGYIYPSAASAVAPVRNMNIGISVSMIILSPPLGAIIDAGYLRLWTLAITTVIYSVASIMAYTIRRGDVEMFAAVFVLSSLAYRVNESVSGSFLPSLCNERDMGFVSSFGFFFGFLSGISIIAIYNEITTSTGNVETDYDRRGQAMLMCGIVELLSIVPTLLLLDNGKPAGTKRKLDWRIIPNSFVQNARTFRQGFTVNKHVTILLINYLCYSIALQTIQSYSSIVMMTYGPSVGLDITSLQQTIMVYNVLVAVGCVIFGILARFIGSKPCIITTFVMALLMGFICIFWDKLAALFHADPGQFWLWGGQVFGALSIGPSQALIRGVVGILADPTQKAEIFGVMESFVLIGNLLGSTIPSVFVSMGFRQYGIWITSWIFVSLVMICFIPISKSEKRIREAAAAGMGEVASMTKEQIALVQIDIKNAPVIGEARVKEESCEDSDSNHSSSTSSSSSSSSSKNLTPSCSASNDPKSPDIGDQENLFVEDREIVA